MTAVVDATGGVNKTELVANVIANTAADDHPMPAGDLDEGADVAYHDTDTAVAPAMHRDAEDYERLPREVIAGLRTRVRQPPKEQP